MERALLFVSAADQGTEHLCYDLKRNVLYPCFVGILCERCAHREFRVSAVWRPVGRGEVRSKQFMKRGLLREHTFEVREDGYIN